MSTPIKAWHAVLIASAIATGFSTVLHARDPGINQPGAAGNVHRDPGINQPGAAGNVGAPGVGRDPGINQPGAGRERGRSGTRQGSRNQSARRGRECGGSGRRPRSRDQPARRSRQPARCPSIGADSLQGADRRGEGGEMSRAAAPRAHPAPDQPLSRSRFFVMRAITSMNTATSRRPIPSSASRTI